VDAAQSIDAGMSLKFAGKRSWTVNTLLQQVSHAGPAPDIFWRLPKDSLTASYGVGADPKRWEPIVKSLADLLDAFLETESMPRGARTEIADLVRKLPMSSAASCYASGTLATSGASAGDARDTIRQTLGWHLIGVEEKQDRWLAYFKQLARAYESKQIRGHFERKYHAP